MEGKQIGALALIVFGSYLMAKNLGVIPRVGVLWPLLLIALGLIALYQASSKPVRRETESGEVIYEVKGLGSLLQAVVIVPIVVIVVLVALIMLGVLGPFFLLSLLFIPFFLFFKLGWAFLKVMLAIVVGAAPFLVILFLLFLIF